jgi:SAM-dependent methyltransferase
MDAEAIAWCNEGYREDVRWGRYAFIAARSGPPLPFSPGYFDLVCGVSIFAHMPAGLRLLWLSELRRITRPEGFLVLRESVGTLEKYFTVLNRIPSGVAGEQDLVLCMRHPALVI